MEVFGVIHFIESFFEIVQIFAYSLFFFLEVDGEVPKVDSLDGRGLVLDQVQHVLFARAPLFFREFAFVCFKEGLDLAFRLKFVKDFIQLDNWFGLIDGGKFLEICQHLVRFWEFFKDDEHLLAYWSSERYFFLLFLFLGCFFVLTVTFRLSRFFNYFFELIFNRLK